MSTPRTFTVGPTAHKSKVSTSLLRVWERQKLIPEPARSSDGRRQYTDKEVEFIVSFAQQRREGRGKQPADEGDGS